MTLKNHTLKILSKYILTMIIIYIKMDLKKTECFSRNFY